MSLLLASLPMKRMKKMRVNNNINQQRAVQQQQLASMFISSRVEKDVKEK
jgi:hypothetical protein